VDSASLLRRHRRPLYGFFQPPDSSGEMPAEEVRIALWPTFVQPAPEQYFNLGKTSVVCTAHKINRGNHENTVAVIQIFWQAPKGTNCPRLGGGGGG
jgi:hypothetical protein